MTAFEGFKEDLNDTLTPLHQKGYNMIASGKETEDGWLLLSNSKIDIAELEISQWSAAYKLHVELSLRTSTACYKSLIETVDDSLSAKDIVNILSQKTMKAKLKSNYQLVGSSQQSKNTQKKTTYNYQSYDYNYPDSRTQTSADIWMYMKR